MHLSTVNIEWVGSRRTKSLEEVLQKAHIPDFHNYTWEISDINAPSLNRIFQIISNWLLVNKETGETKKRKTQSERDFQKLAAINFVQTVAKLPNMSWSTFLLTLRAFVNNGFQVTEPVGDFQLEQLMIIDRQIGRLNHPLYTLVSAMEKIGWHTRTSQIQAWMVQRNNFLLNHTRLVFPGKYVVGTIPLSKLPEDHNGFVSVSSIRDGALQLNTSNSVSHRWGWAVRIAIKKISENTVRVLWILPSDDRTLDGELAKYMITRDLEVPILS